MDAEGKKTDKVEAVRYDCVNPDNFLAYSNVVDNAVNTDELVRAARSSSACFPVFQCMLSVT